MVGGMWKTGNGKICSLFFIFLLVCPIFSVYESHVIAPISPRLILVKIITRVAAVTSYVVEILALELGFKQHFSS